jgi:hypothetical protein
VPWIYDTDTAAKHQVNGRYGHLHLAHCGELQGSIDSLPPTTSEADLRVRWSESARRVTRFAMRQETLKPRAAAVWKRSLRNPTTGGCAPTRRYGKKEFPVWGGGVKVDDASVVFQMLTLACVDWAPSIHDTRYLQRHDWSALCDSRSSQIYFFLLYDLD